jgi:hypothetical protein
MEEQLITVRGEVYPVDMGNHTVYSIWVFVHKGDDIACALHFRYQESKAEAEQHCEKVLENTARAMEVALGYLPSTA